MPESVDGVVDGVVDGLVDGVESSPMFGQSLVDVAAMYESSATAAGVDAGVAAVPDELVAACATAPPASTAVAARITMSLSGAREHLRSPPFRGVSTQSTNAP